MPFTTISLPDRGCPCKFTVTKRIRDFARFLTRIAHEMNSVSRGADVSFQNLSNSWRDDRFYQFKKEYEAAAQDIDYFLRISEAYVLYLEEKARRIDRFLERR